MPNRIASLFAYIRGVLFFGTIALWFVVVIFPWTIFCIIFRRADIYPHIQVPFFRFFFWLFNIRPLVSGREHLTTVPQYIILSNHQSFLDIPLIVSLAGHVAFLAKEELFRVPLFGWAIRSSGSLPVSRNRPTENRNLPTRIKESMEKGYNYCAFPEGTRSADATIGAFKSGIFKYIKEIEAPIIPVTIKNANTVLHKSSIRVFSGAIDIIVHPAIKAETIRELEVHALRDLVQTTIEQGMHQNNT